MTAPENELPADWPFTPGRAGREWNQAVQDLTAAMWPQLYTEGDDDDDLNA